MFEFTFLKNNNFQKYDFGSFMIPSQYQIKLYLKYNKNKKFPIYHFIVLTSSSQLSLTCIINIEINHLGSKYNT